MVKTPNIIEHLHLLLLRDSSSKATIDPILYVAMSIYIIIMEDCAVSHNIDTVGIFICRIAWIFNLYCVVIQFKIIVKL